MWSDIETSEDLLGYSVHASLLKEIVTNEKNLPLTIGLYGDWGSGKSSILKILEEQLTKDDDVVVVYFDGWSFESFDDAKMALIQGIVDALEKEEMFFTKVGDKTSDAWNALKDAFGKLRKSINWMRALKLTAQTAIPIATSSITGGASLIPLLMSAFNDNKGHLEDLLTGEHAEDFLSNVINFEKDEAKYQAVREFRTDFEDLIAKSKQGKIVILIDDLDRCLPRHIIENLEAIKLFLNVPKTAFVIAADQYIVSNAIKSEYKALIDVAGQGDGGRNIGESYMEKFIQLPYQIPLLSPKEVETYVTLLFCQSLLTKEDFKKIQSDFSNFVSTHKFEKYGWDNIQSVLSGIETKDLGKLTGFVSRFSYILGNALKWNPRLIKRFLNAYEVRSSLLAISGITDAKNRYALLKLMLIEQKYIEQFKLLNKWVMGTPNIAKELEDLEALVESGESDFKEYKEWNADDLKVLISEEPKFSTVDMKELFWVSRDNIIDQMSGIYIMSLKVKETFAKLYADTSDPIRESIVKNEVAKLSTDEISDILSLLDTKLLMDIKDKIAYSIYYMCIMNEIPNAYSHFIALLYRIDVAKMPMFLSNKLKAILEKNNNDPRLFSILSKNPKIANGLK